MRRRSAPPAPAPPPPAAAARPRPRQRRPPSAAARPARARGTPLRPRPAAAAAAEAPAAGAGPWRRPGPRPPNLLRRRRAAAAEAAAAAAAGGGRGRSNAHPRGEAGCRRPAAAAAAARAPAAARAAAVAAAAAAGRRARYVAPAPEPPRAVVLLRRVRGGVRALVRLPAVRGRAPQAPAQVPGRLRAVAVHHQPEGRGGAGGVARPLPARRHRDGVAGRPPGQPDVGVRVGVGGARRTGLEPYVPRCIRRVLDEVFEDLSVPPLGYVAHCPANWAGVIKAPEYWAYTNQSILLPKFAVLPELVLSWADDIRLEFKFKRKLAETSQRVLQMAAGRVAKRQRRRRRRPRHLRRHPRAPHRLPELPVAHPAAPSSPTPATSSPPWTTSAPSTAPTWPSSW